MTDSSRGFDEELRARLASLARALRSFKIIKKKLGIPPVTAKQSKIRLKSMETKEHTLKIHGKCNKIYGKSYQNTRRDQKEAQRTPPEGAESDKGATKVQK